jgi:hypothetical protein
MDGQQDTYRCAEIRTSDGMLRLIQDRYPATDEPNRAIPLYNVRIWTVDES